MKYCLVVLILLIGCKSIETNKDYSLLQPINWDEQEVSKIRNPMGHGPKEVFPYDSTIVVSATSPIASYTGLQVLKSGGNAMDAALTAAITSITVQAGATVSFGGFMNLIYYDAASGELNTMNAAYNSVAKENDPKSISYDNAGRTVLVPGFMKGVESAHKKYGSIPFTELFTPSLYFAQNGIPFPMLDAFFLESTKEVFKSEDTQNIFKDENGDWLKEGDLFKQPLLYRTLKMVSEEGADYMYKGAWAEKFVDAVQAEGGHLTMEDLRNYDVIWDKPLTIDYKGFGVYGMPLPNTGGLNTLEALGMLANAELKNLGHYTESPEAMFALTRTSHLAHDLGTGASYSALDTIFIKNKFKNITVDPIKRSHLKNLQPKYEAVISEDWKQVINAKTNEAQTDAGGHSDAIIAVDNFGNVVSLIYTINTGGWGQNGIFVDGISIPDSAIYQTDNLERNGLGKRVPEATSPIIVIKNGKPYLISNCIAGGVQEATLKNLVNILEYDLDIEGSMNKPDFGTPDLWTPNDSSKVSAEDKYATTVLKNTYSTEHLDAVRKLGQPIKEIEPRSYPTYSGMWIGVLINPNTGTMTGTTPSPRFGSINGQ